MDNNIEVFAKLIVMAIQGQSCKILAGCDRELPSWLLKGNRQSLEVVQDGLYNISGISKSFFPLIKQECVIEEYEKGKFIDIVYTCYFPEIFEISSSSFKWWDLTDFKDTNTYNLIMYIHGQRKLAHV